MVSWINPEDTGVSPCVFEYLAAPSLIEGSMWSAFYPSIRPSVPQGP